MHPLEQSNQMPAGRLTVYLGMAAGVGKTFRMLRDARQEFEAGVDVVIGYLEPHDRPETTAEAAGFEFVPRLNVEYHGATLEEMDTAAVIARAPRLALVDELAHTNAPGSTREKRWMDVRELLAQGIDVFTTVNVQHLESLNDQVSELTGTRVRETVPDKIVSEADEVVLVDLTPEALLDRLREGRIYPEERIPSALNNFFKVENLNALRTVALRQVADDVEAKRRTQTPRPRQLDRLGESAVPQAIRERAMVLVTPEPSSQRLIRRSWRSAQRLGCPLDIVWIAPHDGDTNEAQRMQIAAIAELASVLGAQFRIEHGDDVVIAVRDLARELGTTYLLLGPPRPRGALARLTRPALIDRLLAGLPGVDIRVIADRSKLDVGESS